MGAAWAAAAGRGMDGRRAERFEVLASERIQVRENIRMLEARE